MKVPNFKILFAFPVLLSAVSCNWPQIGGVVADNPARPQAMVVIQGVEISAEMAQTVQQKSQGLSGREKLGATEGMLFVFDASDRHAFWMKGMKFPLDIIWIDNNIVVDIKTNLPPAEKANNPPLYIPVLPADYVLEVNAGFSSKHNFQIGDKVVIEY